jgi:hypothetical protein
MKLNVLLPILLVIPFVSGRPAYAQDVEINRELFILCSRFPFNSRCQGVEVPIPLSLRSGDEAVCKVTSPNMELVGQCKINLTDTMITAYVETGQPLNILEGKRRSQEVRIPINAIATLTYREGTRTNTDRLIGNILAFGLIGALTTRPDRVSQLDIGFTPPSATSTTSSNSTSSNSTSPNSANPNSPRPKPPVSKPVNFSLFDPDATISSSANSNSTPSSSVNSASVNPSSTTSDSVSPGSANSGSNMSNSTTADVLTLETNRNLGERIRDQLQRLTGIQIATPTAGDKPATN